MMKSVVRNNFKDFQQKFLIGIEVKKIIKFNLTIDLINYLV